MFWCILYFVLSKLLNLESNCLHFLSIDTVMVSTLKTARHLSYFLTWSVMSMVMMLPMFPSSLVSPGSLYPGLSVWLVTAGCLDSEARPPDRQTPVSGSVGKLFMSDRSHCSTAGLQDSPVWILNNYRAETEIAGGERGGAGWELNCWILMNQRSVLPSRHTEYFQWNIKHSNYLGWLAWHLVFHWFDA